MSNSSSEQQVISVARLISATGFGVFMAVIDSSVVNISLHKIAEHFTVDLSSAQWVILVYLLTISSLMLIGGDFGDRFGNKVVFQTGMLIFTIASLLCAFSQSLEMLVLFRVVQAFGATFIMANGVAIITKFTSHGSRGVAIGWNSLIVSSALVVGPILGGVLTEFFGWASIFLINVPIGILGILMVQIQIPTINRNNDMKKIDVVGATLFGLSILFLVIGLTMLRDLSSANLINVVILIALSGLLGVLFYFWSRRSEFPILNLDLLRNRTFSFSLLSSILTFTLMQFVMFQLPYFLQEVRNLTPIEASFAILGVPTMMALTGPWAGRLSDKIEPKYISTIGIAGVGIVLFLLGIVSSESSDIILIALLMFLFGLTIGVFASPNSNAIMSSAPKSNAGIAGALLGLARNFGFSIGIGLSTAILVVFQTSFASQNGGVITDPVNYVPAFQSMLFITCIAIIIPILTSYFRGSNYYD